ncbi:aldehyde dehydrogenase [Agaricicola taiwanensis]|uniref:Aldehyde dehydrogenase n=1 Tax=Agaricicola taiwanensis TaxID=591372 RepID=A0A8J3DXP2_9RHOB|nr:thiamine pyrophosphate-dependent enzyme [Agaricicola taiwanensis]GGE51915.1 aldehyde dehydrogenase [Agaricicola taiwanensis]
MNQQAEKQNTLLDRRQAVPAIVGRHEDFLIIVGLAGAAQDIAHLTREAPHTYILAGAMGGAAMMGLGLALTQPRRQVLVVTGDGELLMGLGSLATIGAVRPSNLSILCVDNAHYGETGNQKTHTAEGIDLAGVARSCCFTNVMEATAAEHLSEGERILRQKGPNFVSLKVHDGQSQRHARNLDAIDRKIIFRRALLGEAAR